MAASSASASSGPRDFASASTSAIVAAHIASAGRGPMAGARWDRKAPASDAAGAAGAEEALSAGTRSASEALARLRARARSTMTDRVFREAPSSPPPANALSASEPALAAADRLLAASFGACTALAKNCGRRWEACRAANHRHEAPSFDERPPRWRAVARAGLQWGEQAQSCWCLTHGRMASAPCSAGSASSLAMRPAKSGSAIDMPKAHAWAPVREAIPAGPTGKEGRSRQWRDGSLVRRAAAASRRRPGQLQSRRSSPDGNGTPRGPRGESRRPWRGPMTLALRRPWRRRGHA